MLTTSGMYTSFMEIGVKKMPWGYEIMESWCIILYFCQMHQVMSFPMMYAFPMIFETIADITNVYRQIQNNTNKWRDPYLMTPVTSKPKIN